MGDVRELPLDLAWGAEQIAAEINRSPRQVFHMLANGALDGIAIKVNGRWAADRVALRAKFRPTVTTPSEVAA
jgi:hypothetical protein